MRVGWQQRILGGLGLPALALLAPLGTGLGTGCTTASVPRYADPVPYQKFIDVGAMADASRGFPVAFYANPGAEPQTLEVDAGLGTTTVHAAQWLTELARAMNMALAKVSRFDERFKPVSQQVFAYEVEHGDIVYHWREPAGGVQFGPARVATLRLKELKTSSSSEGMTALITVEVELPGWRRQYGCERTAQKWDLEAFTCIGEKVLGDPTFWSAVQASP